MPLIVPPPWRLGTLPVPHGAILRHRLEWVRDPEPEEAPSLVSVIMYNPAGEGEELPTWGMNGRHNILDGMTHRRARGFLSYYTSIRVANLSPYRSTKPRDAQKYEDVRFDCAGPDHHQIASIRWACRAPVVVCAWGAGRRPGWMGVSREMVYELARDRLWCWGETPAGDPLHPSPLGQVKNGAVLVRFSP